MADMESSIHFVQNRLSRRLNHSHDQTSFSLGVGGAHLFISTAAHRVLCLGSNRIDLKQKVQCVCVSMGSNAHGRLVLLDPGAI